MRATELGDHRHDGELPAIDANARKTRVIMDRQLLQALGQIDRARLTPDNQVDYALLRNAIEYDLWDTETLQTWTWNPQVYHSQASNGLYLLIARDFAPWPQRFEAIVSRMEKLPAFLAEERKQLDPGRVPKVYAETVARQNAGIMEIVDAALLPVAEDGPRPTCVNTDDPADASRHERIDYCFVQAALAGRVRSFRVDSAATGSDHKPIWLELE